MKFIKATFVEFLVLIGLVVIIIAALFISVTDATYFSILDSGSYLNTSTLINFNILVITSVILYFVIIGIRRFKRKKTGTQIT